MNIDRTIQLPDGCKEIKIQVSELNGKQCLAYIYFVDRKYEDGDTTEEILESELMVDLDKDGKLRGIEIIL